MTSLIFAPRHLREWRKLDPNLQEIVYDLMDELTASPRWVTRIWSTVEEEHKIEEELSHRLGRPYRTSGIHRVQSPYHRAIDIDADDTTPDINQLVADVINSRWHYDPRRPDLNVVLYHLGHWHCQVHPRTQRRTNHEKA